MNVMEMVCAREWETLSLYIYIYLSLCPMSTEKMGHLIGWTYTWLDNIIHTIHKLLHSASHLLLVRRKENQVVSPQPRHVLASHFELESLRLLRLVGMTYLLYFVLNPKSRNEFD